MVLLATAGVLLVLNVTVADFFDERECVDDLSTITRDCDINCTLSQGLFAQSGDCDGNMIHNPELVWLGIILNVASTLFVFVSLIAVIAEYGITCFKVTKGVVEDVEDTVEGGTGAIATIGGGVVMSALAALNQRLGGQVSVLVNAALAQFTFATGAYYVSVFVSDLQSGVNRLNQQSMVLKTAILFILLIFAIINCLIPKPDVELTAADIAKAGRVAVDVVDATATATGYSDGGGPNAPSDDDTAVQSGSGACTSTACAGSIVRPSGVLV